MIAAPTGNVSLFILGLIFSIDIGVDNTGCRPRMVRRCPPHAIQQFHGAQLVQNDTAPIRWRAQGPQAAFTISSVLIAKHSKLPVLVSP